MKISACSGARLALANRTLTELIGLNAQNLRAREPNMLATLCGYNIGMEVGIRDARNNLSKLVEAVLDGEEVFLTNRGERIVQLVPAPKPTSPRRGRGLWKGKIHFYAGWDSRNEDKRIEEMFEFLHDLGSEGGCCWTQTPSCAG